MDVLAHWRSCATEVRWQSTTPENGGREVRLFSRRSGTPGAPGLVFVHGFPTSSVDFAALAGELDAEFDICTVDFPGYGLSEKPPAPYRYSLYDDARLLVHLITEVWQLGDYRMMTHDRGSSVGIIALGMLADAQPARLPLDIFVTNANIYLPLANLTAYQLALLDDATGRQTAAATAPEMLAAGLGQSAFMPRRTADDPEIAALAQCLAYNDGMAVLPDTIQYLHERAGGETGWLEALAAIPVDTTIIWGLHDAIAPLRVADHVWRTYIRDKPGRSRYWVVPGADHYVQCDAPGQLAAIIRMTAAGESTDLHTLGNTPDGAVLVDQHER